MTGARQQLAALRVNALFVAICLGAASCSGEQVPVSQAQGTVMLDGEPLPGGFIQFVTAEGFAASSIIEEDGSFAFRGSQHGQGIPLGEYRVTVSIPDPMEIRPDFPDRERWMKEVIGIRIPRKYIDAATTPLRATIADGPNQYEFNLETR